MPLLMSAYTPRALESSPKLQISNTGSLASVSYGLIDHVSECQWTAVRRYSYGPSPLACTHKHPAIQLNISTNQNPLITHAPSLYISHTIPSAACRRKFRPVISTAAAPMNQDLFSAQYSLFCDIYTQSTVDECFDDLSVFLRNVAARLPGRVLS